MMMARVQPMVYLRMRCHVLLVCQSPHIVLINREGRFFCRAMMGSRGDDAARGPLERFCLARRKKITDPKECVPGRKGRQQCQCPGSQSWKQIPPRVPIAGSRAGRLTSIGSRENADSKMEAKHDEASELESDIHAI